SRKSMLIAIFALPALIVSQVIISTPTSAKILSYISDYSFNKEIFTQKIHKHSLTLAEVSDMGIEDPKEETPTVTILPNPLEDQTALAEFIRQTLKKIESDKNIKVKIEIVVDKDGNVKDVLTDDSDGTQVVAAIERQFDGIKFEQVTYNGRPIEARFVIPVQLERQ
ncbi:MAG: hypothetical protein K2L34_04505, partial [Muribaculaceae bacterium]|nr:hypothetical protein [Muribaculaceae bacterium]